MQTIPNSKFQHWSSKKLAKSHSTKLVKSGKILAKRKVTNAM